jgi:mannan endo-1,4-beta-mannosidase
MFGQKRVWPLGVPLLSTLIAIVLLLPSVINAAHPDGGVAESAEKAAVWEAEDAVLRGTEFSDETTGYSGSGYVSGFDEAEDALEFVVRVGEEGFYPLLIGYSSPFGKKDYTVYINGSMAGEAAFLQSDRFAETEFGEVLLLEGENRIEIRKNWGYFQVDYIRIGELRSRQPVSTVSPNLATPSPAPEAKSLMKALTERYGNAIIAGQQRSSAEEIDYIYRLTGKLPVIAGFDAEYLGQDALDWAEFGGVVASEWHWPAPSGGEQFYADKTEFDAEKAATPGTEEYGLVLRDLDAMAEKLGKLQDAGVPVLWRPLHEAEGGWFWWGAKGPEAAKALYRLMFDRFTRVHGLNHLIWIWTTVNAPDAKEWYPGDDVVDIVGVDKYVTVSDYGPMLRAYDAAVRMVNGKKMVAFSENGAIPSPAALRDQRVGWLYFNTWTRHFLTDGTINTKRHLKHVYHSPYVVTLDEFSSESVYGRKPVRSADDWPVYIEASHE